MLDLMGFKEEFVSHCRNVLCESGTADMRIEERKVNKAQRGELNGLLFMKEGLNCAPTFYIEDFYSEYKAGTPISDLSHEAVEAAVRSIGLAGAFAAKSFDTFGDPDSLRVRMLNKGRNKEYLKGIPYKELGCDFVYIAEIGRGEYCAVITEELMKEYDMTGDELFERAVSNTAVNFPAALHDLRESAMNGVEECENLLERPSGKVPAGAGPGFVLTNSSFFWGAGTLFYPGMIDRIHDLLADDFYVLPSSIHELIIVKAEDEDPRQLVDLVRSANRSVVKENEILADDLYICRSGKLCRVSYGGAVPPDADLIC